MAKRNITGVVPSSPVDLANAVIITKGEADTLYDGIWWCQTADQNLGFLIAYGGNASGYQFTIDYEWKVKKRARLGLTWMGDWVDLN